MLPAIFAFLGMAGQAAGNRQANNATVEGARTQDAIEDQAREQRRRLSADLAERFKPYYAAGLNQLPSIEAMSNNPDFDPSGAEFGDRFSTGARDLVNQRMTSATALNGRSLIPLSEVSARFNRSEQPRLLNRRMDLLNIGYGQANNAGQNLMQTGSALAESTGRVGDAAANAATLAALNRRDLNQGLVKSAVSAGMYGYNKRRNEMEGY